MFQVYVGQKLVKYNRSVFNGGEVSVKLTLDDNNSYSIVNSDSPCYITANLETSDSIFELMLLVDALKRTIGYNGEIYLNIPYFPYARQDRVMVEGESLSVRLMAFLINSLMSNKVTIWDAHSDVTTALLNNVKNIEQSTLLYRYKDLIYKLNNPILVSPDAGAIKKVSKSSQCMALPMVRADKERDVKTGQITGTVAYTEHVGDSDFLIVDDICDGGRTFIELAKVLREKTNGKIFLYVTHGIFSNGLSELTQYIDTIFCPNVFSKVEKSPKLISL